MIFRRVKAHIEKENWFAVAIDFFIVVVGVFIGIQVANWNDVRQDHLSEAQYLERFADDIELTIAHIAEEHAFSEISIGAIEKFTSELTRKSATDEELVAATHDYLTTGAFFANFRANRTTFDDLITTGNFDIISDEAIRTGLMRLHARYEDAEATIASNMEWVQQGEDRVYYGFDAFGFDARTQDLFEDLTPDVLANDVRENRDLLRRHAAFHYWIKVRSIELYEDIEPQAQTVLDLIRSEQGQNGRHE